MLLSSFTNTGSHNYSDILTDAETFAHLRVGSAPSDSALIQRIRNAALQAIEARANVSLRRGTLSAKLTGFRPGAFPIGPNVDVTSVTYVGAAGGAAQTFDADNYSFSSQGNVQRIMFYNTPGLHAFTLEPVTINFSVGYNSADEIPDDMIHAALLLVGHFYENRQENTTGMMPAALQTGVDALLSPHRVMF